MKLSLARSIVCINQSVIFPRALTSLRHPRNALLNIQVHKKAAQIQREHAAALQGTSPMESCAHHITPQGNTEIIKVLLNTFDGDLSGTTVLEAGYGTGFLIRRLLEAGVRKVLGLDEVRTAPFLKELFHTDRRVSLFGINVMDLQLLREPWTECFSCVDAITCIIGVEDPSLEMLRMFFEVDNIRCIVLLAPCLGFKTFVNTVLDRWCGAGVHTKVFLTAGRIDSVKLSGSGLPRHLWWLRKSGQDVSFKGDGQRRMVEGVRRAVLGSD